MISKVPSNWKGVGLPPGKVKISKDGVELSSLTPGAVRFPMDPIMAMAPEAVHTAFLPRFGAQPEAFERSGALAVIGVSGPLMQRGGWFWDGYESIRARFGEALADPSIGAIALMIDSPGGVCAGCFEAVAAMRRMKAESGKKVYAFADESAYSAGYAVACIADEIYLPEPGGVGSVGVIGVMFDQTKLNEELGFNVVVVASGEQKTDGHPDYPLSKEAISRYRDRTMQLAGLFHELVATSRGLSVRAVVSQQAGCFYGAGAVTAGLANGVQTRDEFRAFAEAKATEAITATSRKRTITMGKTTIDSAADSSGEKTAGELLIAAPTTSAIALAHNLNHAADEGTIIQRAKDLCSLESKVFALTGKTSADEALGAIQAGQHALPQLEKANAELTAVRADSAKREVETLIAAGKADGKITNEAFEAEMRMTGAESPARLRSLLAAMPALVTARPTVVEPGDGITLTEDEIKVAKQAGVTPDELLKHKRDALAARGGK